MTLFIHLSTLFLWIAKLIEKQTAGDSSWFCWHVLYRFYQEL